MTFRVRVRAADGATSTETREAASRAELALALRAEGLLVLSVEAARPVRRGFALRPMTSFDVECALRQLASMVKSGVTLLTALETVSEQAGKARARRAWRSVRAAVSGGKTFAEALAAEGRVFDRIVVRLAAMGEASGELDTALSRAAEQLESRRNLRAIVVNALVYPVLAVAMAFAVSAYLVLAVIPKVAAFLEAGGAELPEMTRMMMDLSAWLRANGPALLATAALASLAWAAVRATRAGREAEDALLLRLPVTGRILRLSGTALFARAMQILTDSGVTLLDALETAAAVLPNARLGRRIETARGAVLRGASLSEALAPAREFMPMLVRMAAVGEVSGSLPETFGETARYHESMLALAVRRFGMLIEPAMIVVTGLVVGFVYLSFFLALFSMADVA
jgi:type IV pilus assembly protein PilC